MDEYADTKCSNCNHVFEMGDTIYPLTLWIYRWNVCKQCRNEVKARIEQLFTKPNETHIQIPA